MRVAVFDTHAYDRESFERANRQFGHELQFYEPRLHLDTAVLARGFPVVCPFVNCRIDAPTLAQLSAGGTRLIALRAAGYNGIDLTTARALGISIVRVPAYSPHAVAEHAFALLLCLVRKIHRAHDRIRDANFSLEGLVGFDLFGKTFGIVGTGKIGKVAARIARGFGCRVLLYDIAPDDAFAATTGTEYVALDDLLETADIVSLHLPLTSESHHLINAHALRLMKESAILVNTSRGGIVDTAALLDAVKQHRLGGVALDVYELEEGVFFENLSDTGLNDDVLARLITFPNVLVTSHQGFLTQEALANIADTTLDNIRVFESGEPLHNQVP
ncbi:2-hydroxyacid dehydrogenase [Burkholderiaceae bacterium DAT-1]|nr:2-hydroxyacid dehydrogenase [Burkholderiaceae bacterium DAT-1]